MTDSEQRRIFSKNINRYIAESGRMQKDIAKDLGYAPTTFNNWCVGKVLPSLGKVQRIADYFGIGKTDLLDDKPAVRTHTSAMIPLYSAVSAGTGAFADGNIEGYIPLPPEYEGKGEFFALRIKGNSMEPLIMDGDSVLVKKGDTVENGKIVIAVVNGNEGFCKKLVKYRNSIGLVSNNPDYDPMIFTNEEVKNTPVCILGTVMALSRKL